MDAPEFYTAFAALYDRLSRLPGGLRRRFASRLAPPRGGSLVEFGCGTGANHRALRAQLGPDGRYLGVDFAPGVVQIARRREAGPRTQFVRGDATRPPLGGRARDGWTPDAVCATFLAGLLTEPAATVRRWAHLVGPGGRLGLLNFRRTTVPLARSLNGPFRLLVRLGAPPGGASSGAVERLDRRVTAAHDALRAVCEPASLCRETLLGGFGLLSTGTVAEHGGE